LKSITALLSFGIPAGCIGSLSLDVTSRVFFLLNRQYSPA
jgi:hypothetical protein